MGTKLTLNNYRPINAGKLIAIADVTYAGSPWPLHLHEVKVFLGPRGHFVSLGDTGKPHYNKVVSFADRDARDEFAAELVALIRARFPGELR